MRPSHLAVPIAACGLLIAACGSSSNNTTGGGGGSSTSAATTFTCATGSIKADGSTALQPLVQAAAQEYQTKCPGSTITVAGGGSSTGLADALSGAADIGNSDVPASNLKTGDPSQLTDHQVAIVIFAVVVNPKSHVSGLTTDQVQKVFSGQVTNWKDVGGADVPITLIERKPGSGTRLSFDKDMMGGVKESATPASTQDSTQLVVQGVAGADGGVSYINVASITAGAVPIQIDGNPPTQAAVSSGAYKFFAHEHMYTKGQASGLAQSFIDYLLTDEAQTNLVKAKGFIPVSATTNQSAADK